MNGLELSRSFFEELGKPMLEREFPECLPFLAAGLTGSGSECYGYDDAVSADHDFEPGFCLFIPDESLISARTAFLLERAYARLPREYRGYRRSAVSPVGGARKGVFRIADYFRDKIGSPDGVMSTEQWISIPEYALAEATNGTLFFDTYGLMTEIRTRIASYPEDVRLKRLAGYLLLMTQAGQYNYRRCISHGEPAAAQLAIIEFVENAMSAIFLLNRRYQPFYKWRFRAFRELPNPGIREDDFAYLISSGNSETESNGKQELIERICEDVIAFLREQKLTGENTDDLERHAYAVNDRIRDPFLRNAHILAAV